MRYLARAFLAGDPSIDGMVSRADETFGRKWRWVRSLARRFANEFTGKTRPRFRDTLGFLAQDELLARALKRHDKSIQIVQRVAGFHQMQPVAAAADWDVPRLSSVAELAAWLRMTPTEVEWFADLKHLQRKSLTAEELRNYHYRMEPKRSGGIRLIEAPKQRLKTIHRQILSEILDRIPPHAAAHGFVRGRNIKTFAERHTGQQILLRLDLQDFFPSIRRARVQAIFRTLGYPEPVADLLGGIVTTRTPRSVFRPVNHTNIAEMRALYEQSHLPQGAPTSPALANACCYRLDCRLQGLASAAGVEYTRYADDLAFSGDTNFARNIQRFAAHVAAIVLEEGFAVNFRKTRTMRRSQQQHLASLVVNERVNVNRTDFDRLKATITNCIRNGPAAENRDLRSDFQAHLAGRIEFVRSINDRRGMQLRKLFDQITWG